MHKVIWFTVYIQAKPIKNMASNQKEIYQAYLQVSSFIPVAVVSDNHMLN